MTIPTDDHAVDVFARAGVLVDERGLLPEALDELAERLLPASSALSRMRLAALTECRTPPDLAGLCMACGRRIAEPAGGHKPGCNPLDRVAQVIVRTTRLARLLRAAARGQV